MEWTTKRIDERTTMYCFQQETHALTFSMRPLWYDVHKFSRIAFFDNQLHVVKRRRGLMSWQYQHHPQQRQQYHQLQFQPEA